MGQERGTQAYSYGKYREAFLTIYRDERLEAYYYSFLKDFLKESCTGERKVVRVHDNRYRNEEGSKIHQRYHYAGKGSMPDLLVVPQEYCYENTTAPYASIELKLPNIKIEFQGCENHTVVRYNAIKWPPRKRTLYDQLRAQFSKTDYIIYTDCITWYFLKKTGAGITDTVQVPQKCLLNSADGVWEWAEEDEWCELKKAIRSFMQDSRMKGSQGQNHAADA